MITTLPPEVTLCIFERCLEVDLNTAQTLSSTCKTLRRLYKTHEDVLIRSTLFSLVDEQVLETYAYILHSEVGVLHLRRLVNALSKVSIENALNEAKAIYKAYLPFQRFSDWVLRETGRLCPSASVEGQARSLMAAMMFFRVLELTDGSMYLMRWLAVHFYGDEKERPALRRLEKKILEGEAVSPTDLAKTPESFSLAEWEETYGEITGSYDTAIQVMRKSWTKLPFLKEFYRDHRVTKFQADHALYVFLRRATIHQLFKYAEFPDDRDELLRDAFDITTRDFYGDPPDGGDGGEDEEELLDDEDEGEDYVLVGEDLLLDGDEVEDSDGDFFDAEGEGDDEEGAAGTSSA